METKNVQTVIDSTKWYQTFTAKMGLLGLICLLLLIPLGMVENFIHERIALSNSAKQQISKMWSGKQTITGPVLNIPLRKFEKEDEKVIELSKVMHIMPEILKIKGDIQPEKRYKGIYKTVVYGATLDLSGGFVVPDIADYKGYEPMWDAAYFTLGISDNRGITGDLKLTVDDSEINAMPGVYDKDMFSSGVSFRYPLTDQMKRLKFHTKLNIKGSDKLTFNPIGRNTHVKLNSTWQDPSFNGEFLPVEREISKDGFTAEWHVTELNRSFPQTWTDKSYKVSGETFGVDFLIMANHYQKSLRSVKYGILFIILTFVVLIFVEVLMNNKIQLFHYILVGFALILFFSLLTALSEHIGFNAAYSVAMIAIIALLSYFSWGFIESKRGVLIVNGILTLFYVFIFVLLSLEDYAFLAGNIGLFVILSVVMVISRKLKLNREHEVGQETALTKDGSVG